MFITYLNSKKKINSNKKEEFITTLNSKISYYLTILDKKTLIINTSNSYRNMYYGGKTILYNIHDNTSKKIITKMNTISHNFTLIKNIKSKEIWGVGGCGKRNSNDYNYTDGIYLLYSKDNMNTWNVFGNIISDKESKGWNPNGDSIFDSNITCFYSNILNKYLLFTRYNIGGGSRGIQVFTSDNFKKKWDNGKLCKINTYIKKENYYMNKIIEIPEYNIFIMVAPFSDINNRSKSGLKILISKNAVDWYDCGLLKEANQVDKHSSTPDIQPVDITINKNKLSVWYHDNYFSKEKSNLYKIDFDIQNFIGYIIKNEQLTNDIKIKTLKIKLNCEINPKSKVNVTINNKKYTMNSKNIIELDNNINLNEIYSINWDFNNIVVYGYEFI
jgi:hypothetical protein